MDFDSKPPKIALSYDVALILPGRTALVPLGSLWIVRREDGSITSSNDLLETSVAHIASSVRQVEIILTPNPSHVDQFPNVTEIWGKKVTITAPLERLDLEGKTASFAPYKARLPNGTTVELLGVSDNPSQDRPWWRPDGSPLAERPYDWLGGSVTPGEHQVGREIAVQLGSLSTKPANVIWKITPSFSTVGVNPVSGLGSALPNVYAVAAAVPANKTVADVGVGVAGGEWKTVIEVPDRVTHAAGVPGGFVAFSDAYEKDGKVCVPVATNLTGVELRVVAVDKDGQEHPGSGPTASGGTMNQITANFGNLRLADVKAFRLQSRPYQWVEFRNVSLQAGQKTTLKSCKMASRQPRTTSIPRPT